VSFEPVALGEIRFWVDKQGWRSKETPYSTNFQIKAWRRQGEHVQMTWRDTHFSVSRSWDELDSWFTVPASNPAPLPYPASGVNVLRTFIPTYDFAEMSDEEVLHYLSGKEITWSSAETGAVSKYVIPKAPSTSMSRSRTGRRAISFAPSFFVSAALDAITEIR
jgi:hypothetical protein